MSKVTIRPHTQSVFEKLKQSSFAKELNSSDSNKKTSILRIPISQVSINAQNVRKTFKSLESLSEFTKQIDWPDDAFTGGLEDPIQWIGQITSVSDEDQSAFQKIVQRALSIQSIGQLQPVGAIKIGQRYNIVYGSTRAMACYLLKMDIALIVLDESDSLASLKAHLFENLERDDLTFAETVTGYLRLFEILLESGEIDRISRSSVMKILNLSRTQSLVWSKILNHALNNVGYRSLLETGEFSTYRTAIAHIQETTQPTDGQEPRPSLVTDFIPESTSHDHNDVETEHATIETVVATEVPVPTQESKLSISEPPSPRIHLSREASHANTMIEIVTAAFERLANQADHPASLAIRTHMDELFPIEDLSEAQRSIDWLAKVINEASLSIW